MQKKEQRAQWSWDVEKKILTKFYFWALRHATSQPKIQMIPQLSSFQKPENLPEYHREETTEKTQNEPWAQGTFVGDKDLALHISTTVRLTPHNYFLKTGVENKSTWQLTSLVALRKHLTFLGLNWKYQQYLPGLTHFKMPSSVRKI